VRRLFVFTIIPLVIALMSLMPALAGGKLEGKVIALDAGHGGHDVGAANANPANLLNESDMNISVVNLLKQQLEADGAKVVMTRTDNTFVGLYGSWLRSDRAQQEATALDKGIIDYFAGH